MQAIREIIEVKSNKISYRLPQGFTDTMVELILLPVANKKKEISSSSGAKSLRGSLNRYADPALRTQEQAAWSKAAERKHEAH